MDFFGKRKLSEKRLLKSPVNNPINNYFCEQPLSPNKSLVTLNQTMLEKVKSLFFRKTTLNP